MEPPGVAYVDPVLVEVSAALREAEELAAHTAAGTRIHAVAVGSASILRAFLEDLELRPRDRVGAQAALDIVRATLAQSGSAVPDAVPVTRRR